MELRRSNFATYAPNGVLLELFCKICGTQIASTYLRPGPHPSSVPQLKFSRNNLYAEIKMAFEDGSHHVTNGCKNCLGTNMPPELLESLFEADMQDLGAIDQRNGKPTKVVVYDSTGGGII